MKEVYFYAAMIIIAGMLAYQSLLGGPAQEDEQEEFVWPMLGHDAYRTGNLKARAWDFEGVPNFYTAIFSGSSPPENCASCTDGEGAGASPVIADLDGDGKDEGLAYFQDAVGEGDPPVFVWKEFVMAVSWNGKPDVFPVDVLWRFFVPSAVHTSFAVGDIDADGLPDILFGSDDGNLYALDAKGNLQWKYTTKDKIRSSPTIARLGNRTLITFGSDDGNLYALDAKGNLQWKYTTKDKIRSSPAIARLGNRTLITFGSDDGNLYALDAKGNLQWKYTTKGKIRSSPLVLDGVYVAFGSDDASLYVLGPSGALVNKYGTGGIVRSAPAFYLKGNVTYAAAGSADGNVYFFNRNNAYYASLGEPVYSNPQYIRYGKMPAVLVQSSNGSVFIVSDGAVIKVRTLTNASGAVSPALGDLNGDGLPDLMGASAVREMGADHIRVWLGVYNKEAPVFLSQP